MLGSHPSRPPNWAGDELTTQNDYPFVYGGTPQHLCLKWWGKWRILGTKHEHIRLTFYPVQAQNLKLQHKQGGVRVLGVC